MRGLLGISCFKLGISSLGLRLCILSLGNYIPDRESVLEVVGLGRLLDLLTLTSPY